MKKYTFEYQKVHEVEKGTFDIYAETQESATKIATMLNPDVKLISEADSNRETPQSDTKLDLF
jgi:hypothetical protein